MKGPVVANAPSCSQFNANRRFLRLAEAVPQYNVAGRRARRGTKRPAAADATTVGEASRPISNAMFADKTGIEADGLTW
jgi:hypothetical protein